MKVKIYKPYKTATQSGLSKFKHWIVEFPKDNNLRRELFSQVIQKSKSIHCAVEHLILNDLSSFKKIEEIYFTANTYQDISNTKDIKNFVY